MKKLFIIATSLLMTTGVFAQPSMREAFTSMPDSIMPYLSKTNRLDFIDFLDSNMDAVVTNQLGGKSIMKQLSDDYLLLEPSASTKVEMLLLPFSGQIDSSSVVICVITTYSHSDLRNRADHSDLRKGDNNSDLRESTVKFYSSSWRELPSSDYFPHFDSSDVVSVYVERPVSLCVTFERTLNRKALEDQPNGNIKPLKKLNWSGKRFNEY